MGGLIYSYAVVRGIENDTQAANLNASTCNPPSHSPFVLD
jgi:hypothetical protein